MLHKHITAKRLERRTRRIVLHTKRKCLFVEFRGMTEEQIIHLQLGLKLSEKCRGKLQCFQKKKSRLLAHVKCSLGFADARRETCKLPNSFKRQPIKFASSVFARNLEND